MEYTSGSYALLQGDEILWNSACFEGRKGESVFSLIASVGKQGQKPSCIVIQSWLGFLPLTFQFHVLLTFMLNKTCALFKFWIVFFSLFQTLVC